MDEKVGPSVGIIIIVILMCAGGVYFLFTQQQDRETVELPTIEETL